MAAPASERDRMPLLHGRASEGDDLKGYQEHLADCRKLLRDRPRVWVDPRDSLGMTLAARLAAPHDLPSIASSAMDGYAARSCDVPGTLTVVGEVPAGRVPDALVQPGIAIRIMTGAMVPGGADVVVPVEETEPLVGGAIHVPGRHRPGRHVRTVGEDIHKGDLALDAGTVIGPAQLALLLALQVERIAVQPRWKVSVYSTGDELVAPGDDTGPVGVVDANGPALTASICAAGAEIVRVGRLPDDPRRLADELSSIDDSDLVITSGGISMGAYDVVKAALSHLGIMFPTVAIQPGKPQALGHLPNGTAFLGLPGNPVSALVSFELFGRAALGRELRTVHATLANPVLGVRAGKTQFLPGRHSGTRVHVDTGPGSHLTSGLARADCLVRVPEDVESIPANTTVELLLL